MAIAQTLLDELWDFSDAAASEERLRSAAERQTDAGSRAEVETQVARALGLQERFDEADEVLDRIRADSLAVGVRVSLERGRLRNSAGDPSAAVPLFRAAAEAASGADLAFLRLDALHMLAIADADHREQWTARAFAVLDALDDQRSQRWRVALHNNIGWAHFDDEDYAAAIAAFEESKAAAIRWGTPQQVVWADEAIAEARSLL
jgi:tetratricopeptide (TPR) repeat protein